MTAAVEQDAAAFDRVLAAYKLPKSTPEERRTRLLTIEQATLQAAQVQLYVARQAVRVLDLAEQVVALGNLNAISDGGTAAAQARAALTGAGYNVRINLTSLKDQALGKPLMEELQVLEKRADILEENIRTKLMDRGGMPLA